MTVQTHSILIVDDNPELAKSLGKLLAEHNYRVETASRCSDALRKLRRNLYDIVVCDIDMPGMNGLDLLEKIRQDGRAQEVILMTGFMEQEHFVRAIRLGASDFINKPVEIQHLLKSIEIITARLIDRRNKVNMFNSFEQAEFSCVIDPQMYSAAGVTKILNPILQKNLELPHDTLSDLLTCTDEMLQNAFIHGILELTDEEWLSEHDQLCELIRRKLLQPEIVGRRMRFSMWMEKEKEAIAICVEDDGPGFDYESWLKRLRADDNLSMEAHGRGLAMLYFLSDHLEFGNGGRKVMMLRKLQPRRNAQA